MRVRRAHADRNEQAAAFPSNTARAQALRVRAGLLILVGHPQPLHHSHQEHTMFHVRTTTKASEKVVPIPTSAATARLSYEAPGTMFRLGFGAIALACCLIAVTGDARARQQSSEELAYCTRLHGPYWKSHANSFHHDGTWA